MSIPRLPFLYPQLFRSPRSWEAYSNLGSLPPPRKHSRSALFHSNTRSQQGTTIPQRYGPATEPLPPPSRGKRDEKKLPPPTEEVEASKKKKQAKTAINESMDKDKEHEQPASKTAGQPSQKNATSQSFSPELDAGESQPSEPSKSSSLESTREQVPAQLEKVLHMDPPTVSKGDNTNLKPHMQAPPYVHHFDTYTLVKDLGKDGFTQEQSVTIMKAIRSLLAVNLEVAKDGLVSKSDVENEIYLFRAACSELKTEVTNTRKREAESMRSERAHLQHEVDILSQKLAQESGALKDDLKGMFDDRKMATRMEQRSMESSIQELNYKITVGLVGDSKGEVEGLRWFLTRRAAMFIGSMALLTLGYLRYSTFVAHMEQEEKKRVNTSTYSGSGGIPTSSSSVGTQTGGGTDLVLASMEEGKGDGVSYVSLG